MNILVADFVAVFLIMLRIVAALIASPIYGHKAIPTISKLFLSLVVAYIIFLTLKHPAVNFEITLWSLSATAAKEIITGLIIGFMLNFVFYGISYAGTLIGFDIGLSMAEFFNPLEDTQNNVIGELIYLAAIMVFFLINGHHYVIRGLAYSFTVIPLGKFTINHSMFDLLIKYSASVFVIAVKIASPIMVSFFLVHIAEGIISRVIPQMQVFFVAQPLQLGLGFIMLSLIIPIYVYVIKDLLKIYENNLFVLIKAMGS